MTKAQTKADLEKLVKSLQRKVAKLERQLAPAPQRDEQPHVTPLPQNAFPWEKS